MTENVKMKSVKNVKKRRRVASLERKKARAGWLFILPFIIGFVLIYIPIIYSSLFQTFVVTKGQGLNREYIFQGWKIYSSAITAQIDGQQFLKVLTSGVVDMMLDIPMILLFSLFMAILLNQKMAGRAAFRAILFVPVILSTGIMNSIGSSIDTYMGTNAGVDDGSGSNTTTEIVSALDVQKLFSGMAIGDGMLEYVTGTINRIYDIVNRSGVQMLIFLAGLQSISPAIYESVQIDGATAWETFWKITFPMISPMILVNAVYTVIDAFTTRGSVMAYIEDKVQNTPQLDNSANVAIAMSWIYFLVVIAILGLIVALFSSYVFYQKKK